MSDQKNLIVAIALSVAILLGFQFFYEVPRTEQQQAEQARQLAASGTQTPGPEATSDPLKPGPDAPASGSAEAPAATAESAMAASPRVAINSPRLHGSIALRGARIDDLTLADYHVTVEKQSPEITLLSPVGSANPYYAEFGWTPEPGSDVKVPTSRTLWQAEGGPLTPASPLKLTWDNGEGLRFERVVALDRQYMFTVKDSVVNYGEEPVTLYPYGLVSRHGMPKTVGFYILHEGFLGVFNEKLLEEKYDDIAEDGRVRESSNDGWLGITDKYWLTALVPSQGEHFEGSFRHSPAGEKFQADYLKDAVTVPAGASAETTNRLFAGAKEVGVLEGYEDSLGIQRFDLAIDWGWFYFLTKPIFYALDYIYGVVGNFGLAIIILVIAIKIVFLPLAHKSYVSMSKMKNLQPEMMKLRERYGEDRAKLNQEMMGLYKKEKVNPASGCLPILLQIPVFFALYKVLFVSIEMRHQPFYGWISDLSAPDPTNIFTAFGMIPWDAPSFLHLGIWPLLMGVSMFLQQKLNPQPVDPMQARIFLIMPIMFTFLLASFPAGLVIYWTCNNLLSMGQQWLIMHRMKVKKT
ncbi:membrane protein insertase YidC [Oceanibacterium hippocampi]|uniref:Membrane protein insertase YidC n=1 Tax=Oceanibacterium hippocampi TaxID=745714 RepID=A0A1Y5RVC9_9PROT|nr:membrane protein insertase YidC [Oceanibacterium hippocampi]SLN25349.1 Membrane protein insertase YidC [Oceanibacterium hippocampi]